VARILASAPLNISFRRNLVGANLRDWHKIVASLHDVDLQGERDTFVWALHSLGIFSVKLMYAALINNGVRVSQDIWQIKIPTRIKVFLWYLKRGVVLTKDNLAKRNWLETQDVCSVILLKLFTTSFSNVFMLNSCGVRYTCCLELHLLLVQMIFFVNWSKRGSNTHNSLLLMAATALVWTIWITRNEVFFDKCRPKTFLQVLFRGTHWLRQWARLQRCEVLKDQLLLAGQFLETSALHFFRSNGWLSTRFFGLS